MNQYDSHKGGRTFYDRRSYKAMACVTLRAVCTLAIGASLSGCATAARTAPSHGLNETAIISQPLPPLSRQGPDLPRVTTAPKPLLAATPVVLPAPQPEWMLFAGSPVGQQLTQWGQEVGWHVIWHSQQDWRVPNATVFHGSFTTVVSQVLQDLAIEGAPIHATFYQGNQTLVVTGDTP